MSLSVYSMSWAKYDRVVSSPQPAAPHYFLAENGQSVSEKIELLCLLICPHLRDYGTDRGSARRYRGFATDDMRIDSFEIADHNGLAFSFTTNEIETDVHPNTVDIHDQRKKSK